MFGGKLSCALEPTVTPAVPAVALWVPFNVTVREKVPGAVKLADASAWPIQGLFRHFRGEVEERIASYRSRKPHVQGATLQAAE